MKITKITIEAWGMTSLLVEYEDGSKKVINYSVTEAQGMIPESSGLNCTTVPKDDGFFSDEFEDVKGRADSVEEITVEEFNTLVEELSNKNKEYIVAAVTE